VSTKGIKKQEGEKRKKSECNMRKGKKDKKEEKTKYQITCFLSLARQTRRGSNKGGGLARGKEATGTCD